ncbi:FAD-dependent monooxygenase [Euzebya tangerina]|uniref:FAD-dependent monooxygenase n=1 Tax=Euzebya tangerina TaxID=591198 RepID=UPI00196BB17D|nr:FAD-dependent monooxygenase [Euzebya tangerina]
MTVPAPAAPAIRHTDVLIVGAGPTGLALAATLAQYDVDFLLVDRHGAPQQLSKAAALHARTLEVLDRLGVTAQIMAEGEKVDIINLRTDHTDRMHVDFRKLRDTRFNHMVDIPQHRTEQLLIDVLEARGDATRAKILRGTDVADITIDGAGVRATLRPQGQPGPDDQPVQTVTADWIVGCDGHRSTVREVLDIDFLGEEYDDPWVLTDAVVDWPLPRNEMSFSSSPEGILGVFPLPGDRRFRIAYTQTRDSDGTPVEPDLADVRNAMRRSGIDADVESVRGFWTFGLSHRQAVRFSKGRGFLVGDAAHVHTPWGGQGMNLGISDAFNLGWKLALVTRGLAEPTLLQTYHDERHPIAADVVRTTDIGARAMLVRDEWYAPLRTFAMNRLDRVDVFYDHLIHRLSQLKPHYRRTGHAEGRLGAVHAGDRAPDRAFYDGVAGRDARLHDLLDPAGHTLLVFTDSRGTGPRAVAERVRRRFADLVTTVAVTSNEGQAESLAGNLPVALDRAHDLGGLWTNHPTGLLLVRPDQFVSWAGPATDLSRMLDHLGRYLRPSQDRPGLAEQSAPESARAALTAV